MYLVETDLTYGLVLPDARSNVSLRIFTAAAKRQIDLSIASLCFQEMDSVIKSNQVDLEVATEIFFDTLAQQFKDYRVAQEPMRIADTAQSIRFRKRYGLTFFDSYHAACAFRTGATLLSFDQAYAQVKEIKYKHPDALLRELDTV